MTDFIFPPHARISAEQLSYVSNSVGARSIFTSSLTTVSRAGSRLRYGISIANASDREDYSTRAALQALIARLDGQAHRLLFSDPGSVRRGSLPAIEVLPNNTFASGTAGFTNSGTDCALSVADRILRVTRTGSTAGARAQGVGVVTALTPYAARVMTIVGRGSPTLQVLVGDGTISASSATGAGLSTVALVPVGTSLAISALDSAIGAAGEYFEVPYMSISQCAMVDNAPNIVLRSDEFNDASWTKVNCTIAANAATAHNGTLTADQFTEDSAVGTKKFITQNVTVASASLDYCVSAILKRGTRNLGFMQLNEATAGSSLRAFFDLLNGTVGTVAILGSNWTNIRAFIRPLGNFWYQCYVIGRKISAATQLAIEVGPANVDGTVTYTGTGGAAMFGTRGVVAQTSLPTRGGVTTTTALSTGTLQSGGALHLAGLPPSTDGLLLEGDAVEVLATRGERKIVTANLNSDAAGLGYLQFGPSLRSSPAHAAAVIIHQPFGRFVQTGPETGWDQQPGGFSSYDLQIEEALD